MHSFTDANLAWNESRRRKLANNTYLEHPTDDTYAIRLHSTHVVTFHANGDTVLDSGGWQTVTTKERMNRYLPRPWRLRQTDGVWLLGQSWDGPTVAYRDGVTLHADGTVTGEGEDPNAARKLRTRLRKFARAYMTAFWAGKVPAPSMGDCWGCAMRTADGTHGMGGSSHIMDHLAESYFVPSALACAVKRFPVSRWSQHWLAVAWNPEEAERSGYPLKRDGIADEQLRKSLTRWLYAECGLPT